MNNTELTIGTKVSYNKVSLKNGETTSLESVVKGFYDGYVCLENGDKMFKQALTIVNENDSLDVELVNEREYSYRKSMKSAKTYKAYEATIRVYNLTNTEFDFNYLQNEKGQYIDLLVEGENRTKMFIKALESGVDFDKVLKCKDSMEELTYLAR